RAPDLGIPSLLPALGHPRGERAVRPRAGRGALAGRVPPLPRLQTRREPAAQPAVAARPGARAPAALRTPLGGRAGRLRTTQGTSRGVREHLATLARTSRAPLHA